jgi:UDP:flavonoid glycosyltransferase YjiC (YdhE family)
MRIVVAAIGSRCDVQPYINLCQGLQEAGHDVVLATNPVSCSLARSHGVTTTPVGPAIDLGAEAEKLLERSFDNMYIGMIRVMKLGARLVEEAYPDVLKACEGADLIVTSDTGSGAAEAENLALPWMSVTLQPLRVPADDPNPGLLTRIVWGLLGKLFILPVNRMRKRLGAPPVTDIARMQSSRLILLPVSRHVAPPNPRWPSQVRQTGYWFARPLKDWEPPRSLEDFIRKGGTPIAVSLGVMGISGRHARESARIVLEAVRRLGVRAIVQGWDEALHWREPTESIYFADSMPHQWLFSRVGAVVHHGGFGTTAAVLRAGVPGIVIPHVIDQFYWGQRVFELGVGPRFITRGKLRVQNLHDAIFQALHDARIREKAARLGSLIHAEPDGVAAAVSILASLDSGK